MPQLVLTGSAGLASTSLKNFVNDKGLGWGIAGEMLAPVFDAGRRKAQAEAARYRMQESVARFRAAVLGALEEVDTALAALAAARERRAASDEALARAQQLSRVVAARRAAGRVAAYADLLSREETLASIEVMLLARFAEWSAAIDLMRALGDPRAVIVASGDARPAADRGPR